MRGLPQLRAMSSVARRVIADFRSDTVTQPTAAMRKAMSEAEVGDDVFGDDETTIAFEKHVAEMFGKEAALFCVSGTMSNQLAITAQAGPLQAVICSESSHINKWEVGGVSYHSRAHTVALPPNKDGLLYHTADDVLQAVSEPDIHVCDTALICVENTLSSGVAYPLAELEYDGAFAVLAARAACGSRACAAVPLTAQSLRELATAASACTWTAPESGTPPWLPASIPPASRPPATPCPSASRKASVRPSARPCSAPSRPCSVRGTCGSCSGAAGGKRGCWRPRHATRCGITGRAVPRPSRACIRAYGWPADWIRLCSILTGLAEDHRNAQRLALGLSDLGYILVYPVQTNMVWVRAPPHLPPLGTLATPLRQAGFVVPAGAGPVTRLVTHLQVPEAAVVAFVRLLGELVASRRSVA